MAVITQDASTPVVRLTRGSRSVFFIPLLTNVVSNNDTFDASNYLSQVERVAFESENSTYVGVAITTNPTVLTFKTAGAAVPGRLVIEGTP